jgi:N-acetylglucosamine-6-phosphate deacetylase
MRTACEDHAIGRCCPALHMEGPYISSQDGPRGAHPLAHTRKPDWDEFRRLQDAAGGRIGIVTLAPELPDAIPFIEKLSDAGIVPSIGHTNATAEDIRTAIAAGARLSTHLGNGAHAMLPRHPNYVWEQLAADELYASIIPDGQHLPPSVVKCIIRAKGVERTILISDATRHGGMPPGIYGHVEVRPNGRVDLRGTPYLAGSTLDLGGGVGNAIRFAGISLAQSVQMATLNPARLMNIAERFGTVEAGKDATLVLFTWDDASSSWSVRWTLVEGNVVYRAA